MKTLLRHFLSCLFALWLTTNLISGFKISGDWQTYLFTAGTLTIIYVFIKPVLKLFFLPITFASLGLLSWLVNVAMLYLLTLFVPEVKVSAWNFTGFSSFGFVIPAFNFNQTATFIVVSLALSLLINFLNWLAR